MPRLDLIPVPLFNPTDLYHYQYDNIPLENLIRRQNLLNSAVDINSNILRESIGSTGTLSARLAKALNDDGSLKPSEIDAALHSIEEHEDTINYVRMTRAESDKLALIADEATDVNLTVDNGTTDIDFLNGNVRLEPSSTVTWTVDSPNIIKAHMAFPPTAAHVHYYDQIPFNISASNQNYGINALFTAYIEGSLRVYINGMKLSKNQAIYIPGALVDDPWSLLTYTEDFANGKFSLSSAITDDDVIFIDFDLDFV